MCTLQIKPQKMTIDIMKKLEKMGLIIRLTPLKDGHRLDVDEGQGRGEQIYKSSPNSGTHSLLNIALDSSDFSNFGTHPDNEEFLLLGGVNERKMLLLISLMLKDELENKIISQTLCSSDFICLDTEFNNPEVSFFVMKKNVPHGECCIGKGLPVTFYVTEGSELQLYKMNFQSYSLEIV